MEPLYNIISLVFLLFGLIACWLKTKRAENYFWLAVLLVSCFFTACRWEAAGSDYSVYIINYYKIQKMSMQDIFSSKEIGYVLLNKILGIFFENGQMFHVVAGCFINFSFLLFLKKHSIAPVVSCLMYFYFGAYFNAHNITRQYIAASICLFSYNYIIKRKIIPFILLVILASSFHNSAFIVLFLYPICAINYTNVTAWIYIISIPFIRINFSTVLFFVQKLFYDNYSENSVLMGRANQLHILLPAIILLLVILSTEFLEKGYAYKKHKHSKLENLILHSVSLYAIITIIGTNKGLILVRLASYFSIGIMLFFPMFVNKYIKKEQQMFSMAIMLALSLAFLVVNNYFGCLSPTPYEFFWNHTQFRGGN